MILIQSSAYVNSEFINEIGSIPPCLLPVANKKLLYFQVHYLREYFPTEKIIVALPEDYELEHDDYFIINSLSVEMVKVPNVLSLSNSILYTLNVVPVRDSSIKILYGDTLLTCFPKKNDIVGISSSIENYQWERTTDGYVWCGYFSFSDISTLIRVLAKSCGNFINAVKEYNKVKELALIDCPTWLDFGHINTFFKSRAKFTTERCFNDLKITNGIVWKSGSLSLKINAEANWFESIPLRLKKYIPQFLGCGIHNDLLYYEIEYLPILPLNELFVHGRNPDCFWQHVLSLSKDFFDSSRNLVNNISDEQKDEIVHDAMLLYREKTFKRLQEYAKQSNISLTNSIRYHDILFPSLLSIANDCISRTIDLPIIPCILHGDFCFSNILYDSRADSLKLIDPRGVNVDGSKTIYGDQKYDLAKLAHSFVGWYDLIISGNFELEVKNNDTIPTIKFIESEKLNKLEEFFFESDLIPGITSKMIMPLTILLFLSMLPLHLDNPQNQRAMLSNALRLYHRFIYIDE